MHAAPFLLHALSPVHAGTGHAADIIDLPTARMQATGIPFVPGSSIKGVLRDARRDGDAERVEAVFGPATNPDAHAGALVVGDARLLALPVRAFRGAFAWATSPLLLALAARDLGVTPPVPTVPDGAARVAAGSACVHQDRLFLEDLDLPVRESEEVGRWASLLAPHASPGADIFTSRLAVIADDIMAFLWETATQIDARVRLNAETRTVDRGALWYEESLPPETLLVGLAAADRSRRPGVRMESEEVLAFALPGEEVLQLGGKATTGRGRCRVVPLRSMEDADGAR